VDNRAAGTPAVVGKGRRRPEAKCLARAVLVPPGSTGEQPSRMQPQFRVSFRLKSGRGPVGAGPRPL